MERKKPVRGARLAHLRHGLERVAQGHYDHLPPAPGDDFSDLSSAFDAMSDALARREAALREQNVELAARMRRIESLLDATNDGIAFLDGRRRVTFTNRRFCEILGLRSGSLLNLTVEGVQVLLEERVAHPDRMARALDPGTSEGPRTSGEVVEEIIELTGAEPTYFQVFAAPVRDEAGHAAGRIVALHDVTRERELDKIKTEFIGVVSHELRTPLTSIKGYTDLLLSGQTGEINEIQREFLGILQSSSNRLGNLINDILDISRIEAGRLDVRQDPVDFGRVVSDILRLMKAAADEKELSLDVSFPQDLPRVLGDADKINQVLSNLLSNAIKYTPEGGWVKLSLEVMGDSTLRTCVADSGIGISPADQKRLFQKFFRADNSLTREAGGTGLGLVIVKSIIEMLGGAIWVESEVGRGSKFCFTLPLYVERVHVLPGSVSEDRSHDLIRSADLPDRGLGLVLVIDSDSYVRDVLSHALHRRGYGVMTVGSASDALREAGSHKPDVVLLDLMMPEMAGFEALRALLADPATANLPIITFSLDGSPEQGRVALGAFSFLRNPADAPRLAEALRTRVAGGECPALLLIVALGPSGRSEASSLDSFFEGAGIRVAVAQGPGAALSAIVNDPPDAILIDAGQEEEQQMFGFLSALKSEETIARIPLILMRSDDGGSGLHFHWGSDGHEDTAALEYLSEQVARVLRGDASLLPELTSSSPG